MTDLLKPVGPFQRKRPHTKLQTLDNCSSATHHRSRKRHGHVKHTNTVRARPENKLARPLRVTPVSPSRRERASADVPGLRANSFHEADPHASTRLEYARQGHVEKVSPPRVTQRAACFCFCFATHWTVREDTLAHLLAHIGRVRLPCSCRARWGSWSCIDTE